MQATAAIAPPMNTYSGAAESLPPLRGRPSAPQRADRPFYSLKTDDIDGAKPKSTDFHSLRHVDPLDPHYDLPKFEERPPTPPRFLRDSVGVGDIEGAAPKDYYTKKVRNLNLDVSDITAPAKPRREFAPRANELMMDVRDINTRATRIQDLRPASCNPSQPEYSWPNAERPPDRGLVLKTDCFAGRDYVHDGDFSLHTQDIVGVEESRGRKEKLYGADRRYVVRTNYSGDIEGGQACYSERTWEKKCQKYFGRPAHDPSIRDKDYVAREVDRWAAASSGQQAGSAAGSAPPAAAGSAALAATPSPYSATQIGAGLRQRKAYYGLSKSMLDTTYSTSLPTRQKPGDLVPEDPEAPGTATGYLEPADSASIQRERARNPYRVQEYVPPAASIVQKRIIRPDDDVRTIPVAGDDTGGLDIAKAHQTYGFLPGPSKETILQHRKPTFHRVSPGGIGAWIRKEEPNGDQVPIPASLGSSQQAVTLRAGGLTSNAGLQPASRSGAQTLSRSAGVQWAAASQGASGLGGSARLSGSAGLAKSAAQLSSSSAARARRAEAERREEERMVRELPNY